MEKTALGGLARKRREQNGRGGKWSCEHDWGFKKETRRKIIEKEKIEKK